MNILNLFSVKLEWIRPHNVIYKEVIDGGGSYEIEKDTYILGSSCEKFVFHHSDGTKTVLFYLSQFGRSVATEAKINKDNIVTSRKEIDSDELKYLEINFQRNELKDWEDNRFIHGLAAVNRKRKLQLLGI